MDFALGSPAVIELPAFLSDHMVVQRGQPLRIDGRAGAGQKVVAQLSSSKALVIADEWGQFSLRLDPLPVGGPYNLKITAGRRSRTIKDVLIGDVWVCAGQSNMRMSVKDSDDAMHVIAAAVDSSLRLLQIAPTVSGHPLSDVNARWKPCDSSTVSSFSAVAYHFGKELRKQTGVPIGLVQSALGGTRIAAWMSRRALESSPQFAPILEYWDHLLERFPLARVNMQPYIQPHEQAWDHYVRETLPSYEWELRLAQERGQPLPVPPPKPVSPANVNNATVLYNANIAPLTRMNIAGITWYQGETDAMSLDAPMYEALLRALVRDWRAAWGREDLPFFIVQLANFRDDSGPLANERWSTVRQAQANVARSEPNAGLAVAIDLGDPQDIHPRNKHDVGRRLALLALRKVYSEDVICDGPTYHSLRPLGPRVRVVFDHVHRGLAIRGTSLRGFEVAGADGHFIPAQAVIEADTVVVSSPAVTDPCNVRYNWGDAPEGNLYNIDGLPAVPFRSQEGTGAEHESAGAGDATTPASSP